MSFLFFFLEVVVSVDSSATRAADRRLAEVISVTTSRIRQPKCVRTLLALEHLYEFRCQRSDTRRTEYSFARFQILRCHIANLTPDLFQVV
jgi:hypothetical protein